MAKVTGRKIHVSPAELKKSVVSANKKLELKNKNLQLKIKESEKRIKELESQEKVAFNRIKQVKDKLATDEANAHGVAQALNKYNQKLSDAKSTYSKMQLEESKVL